MTTPTGRFHSKPQLNIQNIHRTGYCHECVGHQRRMWQGYMPMTPVEKNRVYSHTEFCPKRASVQRRHYYEDRVPHSFFGNRSASEGSKA